MAAPTSGSQGLLLPSHSASGLVSTLGTRAPSSWSLRPLPSHRVRDLLGRSGPDWDTSCQLGTFLSRASLYRYSRVDWAAHLIAGASSQRSESAGNNRTSRAPRPRCPGTGRRGGGGRVQAGQLEARGAVQGLWLEVPRPRGVIHRLLEAAVIGLLSATPVCWCAVCWRKEGGGR